MTDITTKDIEEIISHKIAECELASDIAIKNGGNCTSIFPVIIRELTLLEIKSFIDGKPFDGDCVMLTLLKRGG